MRVRFSIRELMAATLIFGLLLGWWLDHRRLARFESMASLYEELANMHAEQRSLAWKWSRDQQAITKNVQADYLRLAQITAESRAKAKSWGWSEQQIDAALAEDHPQE